MILELHFITSISIVFVHCHVKFLYKEILSFFRHCHVIFPMEPLSFFGRFVQKKIILFFRFICSENDATISWQLYCYM